MTLFFVVLLGKKDFQRKKPRGIFCTPKGSFKLKTVYYRPDRIKNIETKLNIKKIQPEYGMV